MVLDMFDSMQQDMRETVRLVDSLYIDLITESLTGEAAKNKLIKIYERMLRINVTVIKDSTCTEDIAGKLVGYYCDLCHATSSLFDYYRELNVNGFVGNVEVVDGVKDKLKTLSSKIEKLEEELYQRDIDIESLEDDLLEKDLMLADRLVKKEHLEKFKGMRKAWGADMVKLRKQLDYKNSVIEKLREELDDSRKEIKELETVDKVYDASNPAKRIDVEDNVIIEMYLEGRSAYNIAKVFNMTQSAIIYRLKQAGVYVAGGRDVRGKNKTKSE